MQIQRQKRYEDLKSGRYTRKDKLSLAKPRCVNKKGYYRQANRQRMLERKIRRMKRERERKKIKGRNRDGERDKEREYEKE